MFSEEDTSGNAQDGQTKTLSPLKLVLSLIWSTELISGNKPHLSSLKTVGLIITLKSFEKSDDHKAKSNEHSAKSNGHNAKSVYAWGKLTHMEGH